MSGILATLFKPKAVLPPKCPACSSEDGLIERIGPDRFLCGVCAKDFSGVLDGDGDWVFDVTPLRVIARRVG